MTTAIPITIRYNPIMVRRSLDDLSDSALMARIADRDESAFQTFCHRFIQWAFRFDMRFLNNRQDAEDAVQEKFMKVWDKANTYRPMDGASVTSYLLQIDRNICLDMLRRSYRKHEVTLHRVSETDQRDEQAVLDYLEFCFRRVNADGVEPETQVVSRELVERIIDYTQRQFNARQFLVFWGFVTGMSYGEIAETYGLSPGSVRGYVARGFAAIRKAFLAERTGHD
ncbi:sigma-70 family RNA polymerase sigma factor [bacterium]|nr:sigma-70 family RNA polymerase sigma factor [candidate division CSSED10-310 bacterium]